jgi:LacI family transcriptional regulator
MLSPDTLQKTRPSILLRIDELRGQFHNVGVDFEVYTRPRCFSAQPDRMLQSVVSEVRAGCWILIRTNRAVQEWFVNNKVPCVMSGTAYDGVDLPCIDINQFALCRHAVGLFQSRGHSRIGFLVREASSAGDEDAVAGFTAAWREGRIESSRPLVIRYYGGRSQIGKALESPAFREYNPTALLVGGPLCCLAAMTHLQWAGKRIPQDVAIICRASDMFFDYLTPSIACYSQFETVMEHAIFQTAMEVLQGNSHGMRKKLLMPEFVPGESLG